MDDEPDRRAGPASKTGGSARSGDRDLRHPLYMDSEPGRAPGTRWKRVGPSRDGLRLLRYPPHEVPPSSGVGYPNRTTCEGDCLPRCSCSRKANGWPSDFQSDAFGHSGFDSRLEFQLPRQRALRCAPRVHSGAAVGRQRGSEPRVRGFESYPQSHHIHPFRDRLTGKTLGFEPGQCAFESCSLSNYTERG